MWLGVVLVAIAGVASVFMVRFLVALLRESSPSVCYWVVPELVDDDDAGKRPVALRPGVIGLALVAEYVVFAFGVLCVGIGHRVVEGLVDEPDVTALLGHDGQDRCHVPPG